MEETSPVPGNDVHHGEAAVDVIYPVDNRGERIEGIGGCQSQKQLIDHSNVEDNLVVGCVDEIPIGQLLEMGVDLVVGDFAFLRFEKLLKRRRL